MKWYHEVNREWLAERKKYVSATDIKNLLPFTPTGKKRSNMEECHLKVWADKRTRISEDDVCSTGPAARGHILEKYAIEEFNKLEIFPLLHHWDDILVYQGDLSCSPDALGILQPPGVSVPASVLDVETHGEVKSYKAADHYRCGLADRKKLEERWQIATAFSVMPSLTMSALIFYNPSAEHPLFWHMYLRSELKAELDMIDEIMGTHAVYATDFDNEADLACIAGSGSCRLEEDIITELQAAADIAAGLNP